MKNFLKKNSLLGVTLIGLLVLPSFAHAAGTLGGQIFVKESGTVAVTFAGSSASYTSTLFLQGYGELFSSNVASGTTIELGGFQAGQVLTFSIFVQNTGQTYYTGSGDLNADGVAHASVENTGVGTSVGFEDLYGGGDQDYNDVMFSFSNTNTETKLVQNPEPGTILLFGSGLLGLGAWRLRKKQA